jgi:hypothetical protein
MIGLIRAIRRYQYRSAKRLGDVQALLQGRIVHRLVERQTGKVARRAINKLTKGLK